MIINDIITIIILLLLHHHHRRRQRVVWLWRVPSLHPDIAGPALINNLTFIIHLNLRLLRGASKDLARSDPFVLAAHAVPLHSGVDDGDVIYFCVGNVLLDEANSEGLLEVDRACGTERVVEDQFRGDVIIKERAEDVGGQGPFCPVGVVGERAVSESVMVRWAGFSRSS
jgi:hypothetical protein